MAEAAVLREHPSVRKAVAIAALALIACEAPTTPAPSPAPTATLAAQPAATPTRTPTATRSPQAAPSADPVALTGVRATPAGPLPESFRYVALDIPWAEGTRTRLWLVDLQARRPPRVVAEWDGWLSPVGDHSVSADGKAVLISARGPRARVALFVLRPETGTVTTVFEEPGRIVLAGRISPDGQRFAFTRLVDGATRDEGIWSGPVEGGELKRIVEPSSGLSAPLMSLAWTSDSVWVAVMRVGAAAELSLAHREGGPEARIGDGDRVAFRRNPPELLVASNSPTASRLYTYDITTKVTKDVAKIDRRAFSQVEWHPTLERFASQETAYGGANIGSEIWLRNTDGTGASSVDLGRNVHALQWSRDGTLLTALGAGDDSVTAVIDLLTGRSLAVLCKRGGTPPADCT